MARVEWSVVCGGHANGPAQKDLAELVCHLWTSGATHVDVRAWGYVPYTKTLKATTSEACKGPVPTDVPIKLSPTLPASDAGGGSG